MSERRMIVLFDSDGVPARNWAPQVGDCQHHPLDTDRGWCYTRCSSRALYAGPITLANPAGYSSAAFVHAVNAAVQAQSLRNVKGLVAGKGSWTRS
jgi:hypothetical protein